MKRFTLPNRSVMKLLLVSAFLLTPVLISGQTPQATPPPPAQPRTVQFPQPVEKTLANGLRVIVIERAGAPLVSGRLLIRNGAEADPNELAGLSNMVADLISKGTEKRSATEIAEAVETLGGSLESSARWDSSIAGVNVISSKIVPALEILSDVVRRPTFKEDEIERLRQQTIDDLTIELGEPSAIAQYVASRVVFGDTAYGKPMSGTTESITRITRNHIVQFHERYYRPDNAILVLGGDIKSANAFRFAQQYFGDWKKPAGPLPALPASKLNTNAGSRVIVVDKPDAGQAAVLVARTGITRRDTDFFTGLVANSVLSGYSGRLNQEIRIKRGLSYGAGSTLDARREVGPFSASAQTKNLSAAVVADLLMREVTRLSTEPVPDLEMVPRKAVVAGNFARNLETAAGLVSQVGSLALHGIRFEEINRYLGNVQAITAADLQRFAATRLGARETNIIIVGNAKEFLPELRKQYPQVEVIPVAELDFNTALLKKKQPTN